MPLPAICPGCQASFRLPETLAGKKVRCQKCSHVFEVPALTEAPVPGPIVALPPPTPPMSLSLDTEPSAPSVPAPVTPPAPEIIEANLVALPAQPIIEATLVQSPPRKSKGKPALNAPRPPANVAPPTTTTAWAVAILAFCVIGFALVASLAAAWIVLHLDKNSQKSVASLVISVEGERGNSCEFS
ncbi:MAG TPA: zinc-ribbon domain-containing protein [Gemmataceae bacterium]|nr:zinc-ribbon domain-containing protein [Gemmataceae bacterium]